MPNVAIRKQTYLEVCEYVNMRKARGQRTVSMSSAISTAWERFYNAELHKDVRKETISLVEKFLSTLEPETSELQQGIRGALADWLEETKRAIQ